MMTGYQEFENKVLKRCGKKTVKVTNSWGSYDAYKLIRKNKWYNIGKPVTEKDFYAITRRINSLLADEVVKGNTVSLPFGMGKLELRKVKRGVSIVGGKLKVTYPIDWHETLKLWYKDPDAKNRKTLIRIENKETFRIKYSKFNAHYPNVGYYEFAVGNALKKKLKDNIAKGKVETLW